MFKSLIGVIALATSFGAIAQALPDPTLGCIQELSFEPNLTGIAQKVALTGGMEAALSTRAPDRVATADERPALELWAHFRQQCFNYGAPYRGATSTPAQAAVATLAFGAEQRLLAELRQGRATYVEFNRRSLQLQEAARLLSQSSI